MTMVPDDANAVRSLLTRGRVWLSLHSSPSQRVTAAALILIGAQMLFRTWATTGSWFMWDDYIFLADVAQGQDNLAWLFHSHFSLVMPVSLLLVKLVAGHGFAWGLVSLQILVLQALASLSCWLMLRVLFGNNAKILVPLGFYLFVPLTIPATVWWSVAINQYPHHIAIFGAIAAHVAFSRSGKFRFAIIATLFLILGFGSYIKAPLILIVLVSISAIYFSTGSPRNRIRSLFKAWPAWLLYGFVTIGYLALWRGQQTLPAPRQRCELPGVIGNSVVDTLATSVVGGPWRWKLWTGGIDPFIANSNCIPQVYRGDSALVVGGAPQSLLDAPLLGVVVSWLVICMLLFYVWSRNRNALLSLWFVIPYASLSILLVYAGRAGTFGSQVSAREVRYFADVAPIVALAIATMLLPIRGAGTRPVRRSEPYLRITAPQWVTGTLVVAFLAGSLFSSITYLKPWHQKSDPIAFPERAFISKVQQELRRMPSGDKVTIADIPLPVRVANPVIYPYNLPSRKLAPLAPQLKAVESGTDLKVLDGKGRIREAHIAEAPRSETGPVESCGYLSIEEPVEIPIVPVVNLPWWVSVDYVASTDGRVRVEAGETTRIINVKSGLHTLFVQTTGFIDTVTLKSLGKLSVCADNVRVGQLHAKGDTQKP